MSVFAETAATHTFQYPVILLYRPTVHQSLFTCTLSERILTNESTINITFMNRLNQLQGLKLTQRDGQTDKQRQILEFDSQGQPYISYRARQNVKVYFGKDVNPLDSISNPIFQCSRMNTGSPI